MRLWFPPTCIVSVGRYIIIIIIIIFIEKTLNGRLFSRPVSWSKTRVLTCYYYYTPTMLEICTYTYIIHCTTTTDLTLCTARRHCGSRTRKRVNMHINNTYYLYIYTRTHRSPANIRDLINPLYSIIYTYIPIYIWFIVVRDGRRDTQNILYYSVTSYAVPFTGHGRNTRACRVIVLAAPASRELRRYTVQ